MKIFTEEEILNKYYSYLPTKIKRFDDLLQVAGITKYELGVISFVDEDHNSVHNLNEKLKKSFPIKEPSEDALRILLLDLSQTLSSEGHRLSNLNDAPLGLMYLAAYLNQQLGNRINIKIVKSPIDFDNYSKLKALLDDFKPEIIGIRTSSFFKDFFHKTVDQIRQWGIDVPIISGGPYATSSYARILQNRNVDLIVLGEGEVTFAEVIEKIIVNGGKSPDEEVLKQIEGIAFIPRKAGLKWEVSPEIIIDELTDELSKESGKNYKIA